jgi:hypothetical protein
MLAAIGSRHPRPWPTKRGVGAKMAARVLILGAGAEPLLTSLTRAQATPRPRPAEHYQPPDSNSDWIYVRAAAGDPIAPMISVR